MLCLAIAFAVAALSTFNNANAAPSLAMTLSGGGTTVNSTFDGLVGWRFTTSQDILVLRLGFYDTLVDTLGSDTGSLGDGLFSEHRIGIFNSGTNTLLGEATVSSGTVAPLVDNFRMADVMGGPFTLTAGTYDIMAQVNRVGVLSDGYIRAGGVTLTPASGISYVGERFSIFHTDFDPTLGTSGDEGGVFGYVGPTFEFEIVAVPEPGMIAVLAAFGGAAVVRRFTPRRRGAVIA